MIKTNKKGAYANRKLFFMDDGNIHTVIVNDKKSQRRYKKFLKKYYQN